MPDRTPSAEDDPPATDGRQVLVVGDGLVGLSAAAFLSRRGLDPTVVAGPADRPAGQEAVERCVVLWPSAVALLAEIGVIAEVAPASVEIGTWLVSSREGTVLDRLETAHGGSDDHPFLAVDRRRLGRVLRDRLRTNSVRVTKRPRRLRSDGGFPEVEFEDGVSERFDLVVGADGSDSWVRAAGFPTPNPGHRGTTTWSFRADGAGEPGTVGEAWGADAMVALVPTASGTCGRLVTTTDEAVAAAEALARFERDGHPVTRALDPPGPDGLVGSVDRVVRPDAWVSGRLALVGDAARSLPPCSLALSLAVEDTHVLAEELAATGCPAALERYEHRRRGRLQRLDRRLSADGTGRHPLTAAGFPDLLELRLALLRSSFARRPSPSGVSSTERR
ncbi:NAD(P)/FAD-dependent oxidoreductase [Salinirubellus sp. GCM10025818]|uniref:FAD-dependent oxidoreductase n=1 Tax=Salinirubellus TaxID=2162630 RepID=UPI0030D19F54